MNAVLLSSPVIWSLGGRSSCCIGPWRSQQNPNSKHASVWEQCVRLPCSCLVYPSCSGGTLLSAWQTWLRDTAGSVSRWSEEKEKWKRGGMNPRWWAGKQMRQCSLCVDLSSFALPCLLPSLAAASRCFCKQTMIKKSQLTAKWYPERRVACWVLIAAFQTSSTEIKD